MEISVDSVRGGGSELTTYNISIPQDLSTDKGKYSLSGIWIILFSLKFGFVLGKASKINTCYGRVSTRGGGGKPFCHNQNRFLTEKDKDAECSEIEK